MQLDTPRSSDGHLLFAIWRRQWPEEVTTCLLSTSTFAIRQHRPSNKIQLLWYDETSSYLEKQQITVHTVRTSTSRTKCLISTLRCFDDWLIPGPNRGLVVHLLQTSIRHHRRSYCPAEFHIPYILPHWWIKENYIPPYSSSLKRLRHNHILLLAVSTSRPQSCWEITESTLLCSWLPVSNCQLCAKGGCHPKW